jgi:hypothetical protein
MKCCEILLRQKFAILRFHLMRCSDVIVKSRCRAPDIQSGGGCQMLASEIARAAFAAAMTEPLTFADEEINGVRVAVRAVGDAILTAGTRDLNKQLAGFGFGNRFA